MRFDRVRVSNEGETSGLSGCEGEDVGGGDL